MALSTFHWRRPNELPSGELRVLFAALRGEPRPPTSLQRLLSPEYVARTSQAQFSAAIMQDPLIAARVLAVVNSPFYGLQKPVDSIEPAVHLLGMETVRGICLRYMLAQAFKPNLASAQVYFDTLWQASAIASELCLRLAKGLQLPQQGALVTHVVLAFVGHLVAASRLPHEMLPRWLELDPLQRARLEQETMGSATWSRSRCRRWRWVTCACAWERSWRWAGWPRSMTTIRPSTSPPTPTTCAPTSCIRGSRRCATCCTRGRCRHGCSARARGRERRAEGAAA